MLTNSGKRWLMVNILLKIHSSTVTTWTVHPSPIPFSFFPFFFTCFYFFHLTSQTFSFSLDSLSFLDIIVMSGGEDIHPKHVEDRIKSEIPFLGNVMVVGDGREYLTCLMTFKVHFHTLCNITFCVYIVETNPPPPVPHYTHTCMHMLSLSVR